MKKKEPITKAITPEERKLNILISGRYTGKRIYCTTCGAKLINGKCDHGLSEE